MVAAKTSVGLLTGGLAHDFNNLLAVILGHAELLEDRLGADDPSVRAVSRTAMRGAELTQRLLAFSRRQSLEPEVMDLDALIAGMTELLFGCDVRCFDLQHPSRPQRTGYLGEKHPAEEIAPKLAGVRSSRRPPSRLRNTS